MARRPREHLASLTLAEFAAWAQPPISERRMWHGVKFAEIKPDGRRRKTTSGQPALTYPAGELIRLHGALYRGGWLRRAGDPGPS